MLSSKIRTTVLTLAAVATLSGMAAPLAGAQVKTGASAETCGQWLKWYEEDLKRANEGVTNKSPSQVTKGYEDAAYDLKLAKDGECDWAKTAKVPPHRTAPVVAQIGGKLLAH